MRKYRYNDSNCKLYLPFDGVDAQTTFVDQSLSRHVVTAASGAKVQAAKVGSGCLKLTSIDDYLTVESSSDFDLGSNWTCEFWMNLDTISASNCALAIFKSNNTGKAMVQFTSTTIGIQDYDTATTYRSGSFSFSTGVWYHVACGSNEGSAYIFVNGSAVSLGSAAGGAMDNHTYGMMIGANPDATTYRLIGRVDDLRISNVVRYTDTFTPVPVIADANTKLLLKFDQPDGTASTNILDSSASAHTITAAGTAKVLAPKMGSGCLVLNGSSDYVTVADSADFAFGTGDLTIKCWVKFSITPPEYATILHKRTDDASHWNLQHRNAGGSYVGFCFYWYVSNTLYPNSTLLSQGSVTAQAGVWTHIEITRCSGVFRMFINGTQVSTQTDIASIPQYTSAIQIGTMNLSDSWWFPGCIDDFSIHNIALHTSNFTPDTTPYNITAVDRAYVYKANSVLKLHCDDYFTDFSTSLHPVTKLSTAQITRTDPKYGNGCMLLDGNSDAITVADSDDFAYGTGAFTIECWVKFTTLDTYMIWSQRVDSPTVSCFYLYKETSSVISYNSYSSNTQIGSTTWNWTPTTGIWYHLALVRNGADIKLYCDGTALTVNIVTLAISAGSSFPNVGADLWIGADAYGGGRMWINGCMDDFHITKSAKYSTTFVPAQVVADANTKLLLRFDAFDSSDYGHVVTPHGTAQVTTTGPKIGTGCLLLDGNSDYLSVPSSSVLNLAGSCFTIEFWFYTSSFDGVDTPFLGNHGSSGTYGWSVYKSNGNNLRFYYSTTGSDMTDPYVACTASNSVWHHLAVVRNNTELCYWLDGVQVGATKTISDAIHSGSDLTIGTDLGYSTGPYFNGKMDEINISNYAKYLGPFVPNARGAF